MAVLTVQNVDLDGVVPSYTAAAAGGDTFVYPATGAVFVHAKNANTTLTRTITVNSQLNCNQGFDHDNAVVVAASDEQMIAVQTRFKDGTGSVSMTYSSEADLTLAVFNVDYDS
jgi:hypothetical protein